LPASLRREALRVMHAADPALTQTVENDFFQTQPRQQARASLRLINLDMEPRPSSESTANTTMSNQQWRIDYATDHQMTLAEVERLRLLLLANPRRIELGM
jgi:hypothetical protein